MQGGFGGYDEGYGAGGYDEGCAQLEQAFMGAKLLVNF